MRFKFGENWADFVEKSFSEEKVQNSMDHIRRFLRCENLQGKSFLDIGSGSGLHSLAAYRLGAKKIVSFDYDPSSVATTEKLRQLAGAPEHWSVMQGSVLESPFMESFEKFDVVYSWGVLHHTGDMWSAIRNAMIPLKEGGVFYTALYSTEMYSNPPSHRWLDIKRRYNSASEIKKRRMEWQYVWDTTFKPALRAGQNPLRIMRNYGERGMTFWTDVKDWLGGYPMDFSGYRETAQFCKSEKNLDLVNSLTGEGNTEFLFTDLSKNGQWSEIEANRKQIPLSGPFVAEGRYCFSADLHLLAEAADFDGHPKRSRLMLYEDGAPLGLAHFSHEDIRIFGAGRFVHWATRIYFSASDCTNPDFNGRAYSYVENW
ncbi:class I SAM-dependent methyltransferase [Rhizobium sp. 57MFTsu3.2]|uniref:class I SAM-dependent methyltransferase n=1 Tax=Rhizobium sp. 57MFTsu3.2 TaxID=1048681 RepID=UPI00146BEEE5|nr:class I SAM-dependent methyltransferase [Rhizobium sp. 57MFTsu3.2]NMN73823.1 Ribosomal protein L11 methylase [Rhizobium sp. 57MFTsu3.2]